MTIPAYDKIYRNKAARAVGNMLHNAVIGAGLDGGAFLQRFIQSEIAAEIEVGNPKYAAGKSGWELFAEVIRRTDGAQDVPAPAESYERSDVYWVGWAMAQYQWFSGRRFRDILSAVPYEEWLSLYPTLHEADIKKTFEVLDAHCKSAESKLKTARKRCGLTQEALSELSDVPLSTVRAYERQAKDLNRAQAEVVLRLADALKCTPADLLD